MKSHLGRLALAVAAIWACAACGRLGFGLSALDAAAPVDTGTAAVDVDAAVAHDAAILMEDAGMVTKTTAVQVPVAAMSDDAAVALDAGPARNDAAVAADAGTSVSDAAIAVDAGPVACALVPPKAGANLMIDDMEDGDSLIIAADGRRGGWYVNNDGTRGNQMPALGEPFTVTAGGAHGSSYSVRTTGTGFNTWGAALGVSLNAANGTRCTYDVTGTHGFRFVAKGSASVTVQVATSATVPTNAGGTCSGTCEDYYATTIQLGTAWTSYQLPWPMLAQEGWGTRASFAPDTVMFFEFAFDVGATFDLSIDDLSFY
jgi:hypothetical protein